MFFEGLEEGADRKDIIDSAIVHKTNDSGWTTQRDWWFPQTPQPEYTHQVHRKRAGIVTPENFAKQ
jgi:hypothetical protein